MATYSMTAFAQARTTYEQMQILLEIRSVNNRYLDVHFRMPDELRFFEPRLRTLITQYIGRGKLDVQLQLQKQHTTGNQPLPAEFLNTVAQQLEHIRQVLPDTASPSFSELFTLAGMHNEVENEQLAPVLEQLTQQVLNDLIEHRAREGAQLATAMRGFAKEMLTHVETVKSHLPQVQKEYQEKVALRLREAIEQASPEGVQYISAEELSARIAQEASVFSLRIDVAEEITRLEAHINELFHLLEPERKTVQAAAANQPTKKSSLGKRMDFLFQEMNREANTLGSKAGSIALTQAAIELKLLIEQLREQAQNIE